MAPRLLLLHAADDAEVAADLADALGVAGLEATPLSAAADPAPAVLAAAAAAILVLTPQAVADPRLLAALERARQSGLPLGVAGVNGMRPRGALAEPLASIPWSWVVLTTQTAEVGELARRWRSSLEAAVTSTPPSGTPRAAIERRMASAASATAANPVGGAEAASPGPSAASGASRPAPTSGSRSTPRPPRPATRTLADATLAAAPAPARSRARAGRGLWLAAAVLGTVVAIGLGVAAAAAAAPTATWLGGGALLAGVAAIALFLGAARRVPPRAT